MNPIHRDSANKRDQVYASPLSHVGDFRFDESVAEVFEDMIDRSVPGYGSILAMLPTLARRFVQPETQIYDLGCSLGAVTFAVKNTVPSSCIIHAVDQSSAMLDRLRLRLDANPADGPKIELHLADIKTIAISRASLVVLNFTLQFIAREDRVLLLKSIYEGMIPGGALLLSEKICLESDNQQRLLTELHHDFKRARGYSDLEIAQKRAALENTLIPETHAVHSERLSSVGFENIVPWFSCLGFASILAVKK
jgi:tRNA (cmo5U34)-methyltransferase